jgi:hypothetical protein
MMSGEWKSTPKGLNKFWWSKGKNGEAGEKKEEKRDKREREGCGLPIVTVDLMLGTDGFQCPERENQHPRDL